MVALTLSACSTGPQLAYYNAQNAIAAEKSKADIEKYRAIATLSQGSDAARVAGVMALALGNGTATSNTNLAAPRSDSDVFLQYLSVLAPVAVQAYGIGKNAEIAINSSQMSRDVAVSTNETFQGLASKIQAPGAVTNNTLSGTGSLGTGTYSTTDNHTTSPVVQVVPTVITPVITNPTVINPTVITPVISETP